MNSVELKAVTQVGDSSHVSVYINKKDVGILYLKGNEIDVLLSLLRLGTQQSNVQLETDLNIGNEEENGEDYDEND
jgi:hypothetical protein